MQVPSLIDNLKAELQTDSFLEGCFDNEKRNSRIGQATDTRYQRMQTHTSNTHTRKFRVRCSVYGKVSRREDKSSKWLQPASLPKKTIIWCCFANGIDTAMLEWEEKASKRRITVWIWISFWLLLFLTSASFDVWIRVQSSSPCSCSDLSIPSVRRLK